MLEIATCCTFRLLGQK